MKIVSERLLLIVDDTSFLFWDILQMKIISTLKHRTRPRHNQENRIIDVALSPDAKHAFVCTLNGDTVVDLDTYEEEIEFAVYDTYHCGVCSYLIIVSQLERIYCFLFAKWILHWHFASAVYTFQR